MLERILIYLKSLNLFVSPLTATNEYELRNERISTRLFILILSIFTLIILIYTAQVPITQNIEVKQPSYDRFESLSLVQSQTLRCACDNVAISYKSFISLKPQFHNLCSSMLISQEWIDYLSLSSSIYLSDDFSYIGSWFFRTLRSFCQLSNKTIENALRTFNSTQLITAQALSEYVFNEEVNALIETFEISTELYFYQSFDLIEISSQINSLLSGLLSNMILSINTTSFLISVDPHLYEDNSCNCDKISSCVDPLTLLDRRSNPNNSSSYFPIPGLFKGCFLVESVRQSSLECFYQSSCISTIEEFLEVPLILNSSILSLDSSVISRFNVTSTINQLLRKAMTEVWQQNISYVRYFEECQVSLCTYTTTSRFHIVYIITTLISLVGGLIKVLRILIHPIVKFIRHRLVPLPTMIEENRLTFRLFMERLRKFNYFFKPFPVLNQIEMNQQIIATRLFFVMLAVSFIILISYYSADRVTYIDQIESPTFEQFIYVQNDQKSNPSFSCPCSRLEIFHKDIIQISYDLHPFCSSDFIKLPRIDYPNSSYFAKLEFRLGAPSLFNSLFTMCQLSSDYIGNSLISFMASSIVASEVLPLDTFILETNLTIDRFISSTKRSFARNLAIILNMTWSNAIMSAKETNYFFFSEYGINNSLIIDNSPLAYPNSDNTNDFCNCAVSMDCFSPMSIYSYVGWSQKVLFDVPGFFMSCLEMETIRFSSLICLFNQSCVDLISFWLTISDLKALDIYSLKNFDVNSTLSFIENEIFVNQWNISMSYRGFYEQCRPDRCTYTLVQHNSIWLILTVVLGLIGGLMKILQVIVPHLVQGISVIKSRCCRRPENRDMITTVNSLPFSFQDILRQLSQLNLFSSDNPTANNERDIQEQKLSTRVFLILLMLSLVILTVYSSQVQRIKTVTTKNPSMEQYSSLYKIHSQTLTCPCKNIAIAQQTFITLQPRFHQVCQSDFVDSQWRNGLLSTAIQTGVLPNDFRLIGSSIFGTISSLCQLSRMTINDGIFDFNVSSFVSVKIIPEDQLIIQGQSLIDLFISTSQDAFVSALQTVRDTTSVNALMPGFQTTTSIELRMLTDTDSKLVMVSQTYNYTSSCTCSSDATCIEPAGIYDANSNALLYAIPGMFIGCYMVEAALQSNLDLLYNQNQINNFRQIIQFDDYSPVPYNTTALNASSYSQYNVSTPIYIMMEKMMTESWYKYINYSDYYEQCQPVQCTYTYIVKYDIIYIITTITALIGGLVTIYQVIIPRVIKLIHRCYLKRRHGTTVEVIPVESVSEN